MLHAVRRKSHGNATLARSIVCCEFRMIFFVSCIIFFLFWYLKKNYLNFTFVFPSYKCVRLHITTTCKLFRGFLEKRNLYFFNLPIVEKLSNFELFFKVVSFQIHFGSGAARIRILLKVSDPPESADPQHCSVYKLIESRCSKWLY